MDISTFVTWGIVIALVLYFVMIFNNLVRLKHNVSPGVVQHRCAHEAAP